MKWENVDFECAVISIVQSKTLRPKSIAINQPTMDAFELALRESLR
jgi:hypothetical protein